MPEQEREDYPDWYTAAKPGSRADWRSFAYSLIQDRSDLRDVRDFLIDSARAKLSRGTAE